MPKPDWNAKQHPEQKSKEHGKKGGEHDNNGQGHDGHGYGAEREPHDREASTDLTITEPDEGEPETGSGEPLVAGYAPSFYVPYAPPVLNQGSTPHCVAYSNGYDANQHDRPDLGRFNQLNEALFFQQIGGTSNGAYMSKGLIRRRDFGYPEDVNVPARNGYPAQDANLDYAQHRIASYTALPLTVTAIKDALLKGHGVLVIGDWFHSWNHPLSTGKLPAPDYRVSGHARWWRGWNDAYGFRERESFGPGWGPIGGDCFVPYAFLKYLYAAYRTTDK